MRIDPISAPAQVLDFEDALSLLASLAASMTASMSMERVRLLESAGRVLAEPVLADRDQPPFDRATRDGYAVRATDWSAGKSLTITGMIKAGEPWTGAPVGPGEALEMMTGAPLPEGADAVAMVEHGSRTGETVTAQPGRRLLPGENVVPQGSEARAGQEVLATGVRIGAAEIALAATCGSAELSVFGRPRVAVVATGDELVELDMTPAEGQIRNSNSYALAALVAAAGADPVRLPATPDTREAVAASLAAARAADLIVFSGGVSMGQYDLVEEALLAAGAEFFFTGVRLQPGRPVVMGRLPASAQGPSRYFFGLPGNPISTQVTFHCFVEPFLRALGSESGAAPRWALARLAEPAEGKLGLTRVLPARIEGCTARIVAWQGSGDLAANARANGYAELPADAGPLTAGTVIRVLLR